MLDPNKVIKKSYYKETKFVDIHTEVYGIKEKNMSSSYRLRLMEAGSYFANRIFTRQFGVNAFNT